MTSRRGRFLIVVALLALAVSSPRAGQSTPAEDFSFLQPWFRITEQEISQREERAQELESRLKALQEERSAAIQRKQKLESAENRIVAAEQELERLTAELAELKGEAGDANAAPAVANAEGNIEHTVQQGENLASIASRYRIPAARIRETNGNMDVDNLSAGQVVLIPPAAAAER